MKIVNFGNLNHNICVYLSFFWDLQMIGRISQINKNWNKNLKQNGVKLKNASIFKRVEKKKKGMEKTH